MAKRFLFALTGLAFSAVAFAAEPDEQLADPALEARAAAIDEQLRCVVCQSQSIAESNADLAREMRVVVRERIEAGDDDEAVIDYIAARYGDYVRLKPELTADTAALWLFPLAIFLAGLAGGAIYIRHLSRNAPSEGEAE